VEETWGLDALDMTRFARISLYIAAAAFAALSACVKLNDESPLIRDAASEVKSHHQEGKHAIPDTINTDVFLSYPPQVIISVSSEPLMTVSGVNYPIIILHCNGSGIDAWYQGRPAVSATGDVDMRAIPGKFWDRSSVYFDEVKTSLPISLKIKMKQVHVGDGKYETRSENVGTNSIQTIKKILLPKLKSSKTMRIGEHTGRADVFALDGIKDKIETLESQCAPESSQND